MSLSRRNVSCGPPAIDERGKNPGEKHAREDEQTDRDRECDSDSETGERGHSREPLADARRREMPDEEEARHASAKAVVAALLLAGVVVIGVVIFLAVVIQRAC
jgi:hypothetical protein